MEFRRTTHVQIIFGSKLIEKTPRLNEHNEWEIVSVVRRISYNNIYWNVQAFI